MLTLYIKTYFHDINFQVDHVLTIRGPSFANLKNKRGTKERPPGPKGYIYENVTIKHCFLVISDDKVDYTDVKNKHNSREHMATHLST